MIDDMILSLCLDGRDGFMVKTTEYNLETIYRNFIINYNDIKDDFELLENHNHPTLSECIKRALKSDIIDIFKNIENYLALLRKSDGFGVSNRKINDIMECAIEYNYLDREIVDFIKAFKPYRNDFSHIYNIVEFEDLRDLFLNNECLILRLIDSIQSQNEKNYEMQRIKFDTFN